MWQSFVKAFMVGLEVAIEFFRKGGKDIARWADEVMRRLK